MKYLILPCLLVLAACTPKVDENCKDRYTVSGTVYDANTKLPLNNMEVQLWRASDFASKRNLAEMTYANTDNQGHFSLEYSCVPKSYEIKMKVLDQNGNSSISRYSFWESEADEEPNHWYLKPNLSYHFDSIMGATHGWVEVWLKPVSGRNTGNLILALEGNQNFDTIPLPFMGLYKRFRIPILPEYPVRWNYDTLDFVNDFHKSVGSVKGDPYIGNVTIEY